MISVQVLEDALLLRSESVREDILKSYGARKHKLGYTMPKRIQDLDLISQDGFELISAGTATSDWLLAQRRQQKIAQYLAKAEALKKDSQHVRWKEMMPHQHVGTGFLTVADRALLGFSPRLGKTVCSVVAADLRGLKKILVVTPLTVFGTWERGIKRWSDGNQIIQISHGRYNKTNARWVITNPDSIVNRLVEYASEQWDAIIFDESFLYKNPRSKRQNAALQLAKRTKIVWCLTGNPTGAYADQLFGQLQLLRPDVFTSYWRFANRWCVVIDGTWGSEIVGNKNPDGLRRYLEDLMLTRTPLEVPRLPELEFEVVEVELGDKQRQLVKTVLDELIIPGDPPKLITNPLTLLTRVSQIVSAPRSLGLDEDGAKHEKALEIVKSQEGPFLVWFKYRESIDSFVALLKRNKISVGEVHGGVKERTRNETIARFQSGGLEVICCQLDTGKFGLDLTRAQTIIYHDRGLDLDSWIQSTNRTRLLDLKSAGRGYVLHGGYSDFTVDRIIRYKIKSLSQLSLTDLLEATQGVTSTRKTKKNGGRK